MINWCADWFELLLYQRSTLYCLLNVETANHIDNEIKELFVYLIDQYARLYRSYGYLRIRKATLMHSLLTDIMNAFSIEINYLPQAAH